MASLRAGGDRIGVPRRDVPLAYVHSPLNVSRFEWIFIIIITQSKG
jgi:hypothetical protein